MTKHNLPLCFGEESQEDLNASMATQAVNDAPKAIPIPVLKLNNGIEMPALGFGTFAKEGVEGKTYDAVIAALDAGYRHLDCAW